MKNINKFLSLVFTTTAILTSCETIELDIRENPNALTPEQATADFFLVSIQEDFVRHITGGGDNLAPGDNFGLNNDEGLDEIGMELTRVSNFAARDYQNALIGATQDDEWENAFRGILADIAAMNPIAQEDGLTRHIAIGQFIQAYVLTSMVDFFGDIPLTEALQGEEGVFNPNLTAGMEVYNFALDLLDQALINFTNETAGEPEIDFFYGNDFDNWVLATNTLRLKLYAQIRLVDASAVDNFNAIITSGDYIQDTADDFQFQWGTNASNPDTRNPRYVVNYTATGAGEHMSNWLMNEMDVSNDPRLRYYIYRQNPSVPGAAIPPSAPNQQTLNCSVESPPQHYIDANATFCFLDNGYWGRDHGDDDGIPPDNFLRATWGVYPYGGRFDDDRFTGIGLSTGANGAGITPILTAALVEFFQAEVAMASGNEAMAGMFLQTALTTHIAKVQTFGGLDPDADLSLAPSPADVNAFLNSVAMEFTSGDSEARWDLLAEQFLISSVGMGIDAYNFYRRTGFPTTLQPNIEEDPGNFMRSLQYPSNAVNNNTNISLKDSNEIPVFWDNNPTGPIAN